ncbi:hypothetical protein B0T11DRAFT_348144 [Plectosphaerella cucumerina]|uniref:Uncharacterized protein n=1 Tax=Plectosphaerella cucumerina TaxID=40658 RepID=A0A8K0X6K4_9PEZI|nr:hypothetical protein B0T11DRAFT_348144 [Plectosphaerella cucumerina]
MDINHYERIVEKFQFDNTPVMVALTAVSIVGFLQYIYTVRLLVREEQDPIPFWMQSFYLAHESTWVFLFAKAAPQYDYHWFLVSMAGALFVWGTLEVFCMGYTLKNPKTRASTFSALFGRDPTISSVLPYIIFFQLAMFALVWILVQFMGPGCFMLSGGLTNVLIIVGPTHTYLSRGSRNGLSLGFCLVNVACAVWSFAPFGLGAVVLPELFNQPAVYAAGCILLGYSIWLTTLVAAYPPKTAKKGEAAPIW